MATRYETRNIPADLANTNKTTLATIALVEQFGKDAMKMGLEEYFTYPLVATVRSLFAKPSKQPTDPQPSATLVTELSTSTSIRTSPIPSVVSRSPSKSPASMDHQHVINGGEEEGHEEEEDEEAEEQEDEDDEDSADSSTHLNFNNNISASEPEDEEGDDDEY